MKCRSERAAALEALERVDGLVQGLLDKDDALLRRTCANAATDKVDRDVVARRAARNRDQDAKAAAERGAKEAQRALDDARAAPPRSASYKGRVADASQSYKKEDACWGCSRYVIR